MPTLTFFAQTASNDSVSIALVGIVGTVIVSLFKLLGENTKALKKVAESSDSVAKATNKSAKEAKQRNGHLGEQNIQIAMLVSNQNKDVADILTTLKNSALVLKADTQIVLDGTKQVARDLKEKE